MLPHHWTRLPLPHLFMTVSVGTLTLMVLAAGGPEGSTVVLGSFLAFVALLVATIRVSRRTSGPGRPVLGLLAGLLTGVAGAASLLSIGAISASSPLWVYLPLVVAMLATLLGGSASTRVADDAAVPLPATRSGGRHAVPSGATAGNRYRPHLASQAPTGS